MATEGRDESRKEVDRASYHRNRESRMEAMRERQRAAYRADPVAGAAKQREYNDRNRERIREQQRARRAATKDQRRVAQNEWYTGERRRQDLGLPAVTKHKATINEIRFNEESARQFFTRTRSEDRMHRIRAELSAMQSEMREAQSQVQSEARWELRQSVYPEEHVRSGEVERIREEVQLDSVARVIAGKPAYDIDRETQRRIEDRRGSGHPSQRQPRTKERLTKSQVTRRESTRRKVVEFSRERLRVRAVQEGRGPSIRSKLAEQFAVWIGVPRSKTTKEIAGNTQQADKFFTRPRDVQDMARLRRELVDVQRQVARRELNNDLREIRSSGRVTPINQREVAHTRAEVRSEVRELNSKRLAEGLPLLDEERIVIVSEVQQEVARERERVFESAAPHQAKSVSGSSAGGPGDQPRPLSLRDGMREAKARRAEQVSASDAKCDAQKLDGESRGPSR